MPRYLTARTACPAGPTALFWSAYEPKFFLIHHFGPNPADVPLGMRSLLLFLGLSLGLPWAAQAQDSYATGSSGTEHYVLRDGRQGDGEISFEPEAGTAVTIRLTDGRKVK